MMKPTLPLIPRMTQTIKALPAYMVPRYGSQPSEVSSSPELLRAPCPIGEHALTGAVISPKRIHIITPCELIIALPLPVLASELYTSTTSFEPSHLSITGLLHLAAERVECAASHGPVERLSLDGLTPLYGLDFFRTQHERG